jgi:hypothetical protein
MPGNRDAGVEGEKYERGAISIEVQGDGART